jgi:3'-phosphoadenosine 5'-phosphosulfate sulfotransferase (PAPS reductase)/FAD synthetase
MRYRKKAHGNRQFNGIGAQRREAEWPPMTATKSSGHLQRLEAESIFIMREVAAEFANPVMLYAIGKDSSVMLRIAQKAFFPPPPVGAAATSLR